MKFCSDGLTTCEYVRVNPETGRIECKRYYEPCVVEGSYVFPPKSKACPFVTEVD